MEKKFHELTSELIPEKATAYVIKKSHTDSIIRKWLSEKSKAINADANAERTVDEILGLTDVWEKPCHRGCKSGECFHLNPKQKQSWCEHIQCSSDDYSIKETGTLMGGKNAQFQFKFCPICGTPRPTPKSLVDKFREKTCYLLPDKDNPSTNKTGRLTSGCAGRLARIAEEHFGKTDFLREHKEEL